jgi:hypothetical protein
VIEQAMTTVAQATGRCVAQLTSGLSGRLEEDAALAGSTAPAQDLVRPSLQGSGHRP